MTLSFNQVLDKIKEMVPSTVEVFYLWRRDGETGSWSVMGKGEDVYLNQISRISVRSNKPTDTWISVPTLVDESLYAEWLDRAIRAHIIEEKDMEYKIYDISSGDIYPKFDFYRSPGAIVHEWPDNVMVDTWRIDDSGDVVHGRYAKSNNGALYVSGSKQDFLNYINVAADFFAHPGNKQIHHLGILFPTPPDAYVGKDVYYDPTHPRNILLRVDESWVWANKKSVLSQIPARLQEELDIIKTIMGGF